MTNEELAAAIQAGERDRLPELWDQVRRFAAARAKRVARSLDGHYGVTAEDLYQCGYIALMLSVDAFNPDAGMSFIGWYALHLKSVFAEACGRRTSKLDGLNLSVSLDVPVTGEEDGDTLMDMQEDAGAAQAFEDAERRMWREHLHEALERALNALPEDQNSTLRRRFYQEQTIAAIAAADGVETKVVQKRQAEGLRVLRRPSVSKELQRFI